MSNMNDSFLEDLGLAPKSVQNNSQLNNRYITTRRGSSENSTRNDKETPELKQNITARRILTSSNSSRSKNEFDNVDIKQDKIISSSSAVIPKIKVSRRSNSQEPSKLIEEKKKPQSSTPKSDRKSQGDENLMKPIENQMKQDETKLLPQDIKILSKAQLNKPHKDQQRHSGSSGSSRFLDASSKENTRPSTDSCSSRESGSQADLKKVSNRRTSDGARKSDVSEKTDPVMFLSAIKDLVSRYTEQETNKVLRAMQNLHMNSQMNLIKHLMHQTDDLVNLVKEQNRHRNHENIKSLIDENERMREDIFILRTRNEVLQKKVDEMALVKEENISLKMKLKELQ